jgi:hypothetical protein
MKMVFTSIRKFGRSRQPNDNEVIKFLCEFCNCHNHSRWGLLLREAPTCQGCGSSVRQREVIHAISEIMHEFSGEVRIVGLSDAPQIEQYFSSNSSIRYTNTFFDAHPLLDISSPQPEWLGSADILISSDVFEHVFFPIRDSLLGCYKILKPKGHLVMTMPWNFRGPSVEHYPWMVSYKVVENEPGNFTVVGTTKDGIEIKVDEPCFHGGPGNTLEMRKLSLDVIIDEIQSIGFTNVAVSLESIEKYGIRRADGVVGVITAKKE